MMGREERVIVRGFACLLAQRRTEQGCCCLSLMGVYVTCVDSLAIQQPPAIRKKHLVNYFIANRQTPHKLDQVCVRGQLAYQIE